jgi:DNA-binding MarR family transcriptional regulator
MLYPTQERVVDDLETMAHAEPVPAFDDPATDEALLNLRALIMAGERYRVVAAGSNGLGVTESQAISYLAVHGARGQSALARDLSLTSSAATSLVDRLEGHGVAERTRHPSDRRRMLIRLTSRGEELATAGQQTLLESLHLVAPSDLPLVSRWLGVIAQDLHARTR